MKASVLAELLQQHPDAKVLHVEHYAIDETGAYPVHEHQVFLKGEEVTLQIYFDEYDELFIDDEGKAIRDLIVLL